MASTAAGLVVPGLATFFLCVMLQGCGDTESDPDPVTSQPCRYQGCDCQYYSNDPSNVNDTESSWCLNSRNESLCDGEVCRNVSFLGQDGNCTCQLYDKAVAVDGRAFLTDNGTCVASIHRSSQPDTWTGASGTSPSAGPNKGHPWGSVTVSPDLASHFVSVGLAEHASVASFARVVMELMQLAAPAQLVDRTLEAGREEVRHAQLAFSLARGWSGEGYQLGPLNGLEYAPVSLMELAKQTVFEAILGETPAALRASLALRFASHQGVREFLLQVARDERRHAELAWATVAWAVQAGKAEVLQEVLVALDAAEERLAQSGATKEGNLAYGILSSELESAVRQEAANLVKRIRLELSNESLLRSSLSSFELRVQQEFGHSISRMEEVKEVAV